MKKGRTMELFLFLGAVGLTVTTGWLYFEKTTRIFQEMDEITHNTMSVEDGNDINQRLSALEAEMKNPKTMNLIMKEPVRVVYKPIQSVPPQKATPIPPLPGNIPKLKSQLKKLSQ